MKKKNPDSVTKQEWMHLHAHFIQQVLSQIHFQICIAFAPGQLPNNSSELEL